MVDVSEIVRFTPGKGTLQLGKAEGGKKTGDRLLELIRGNPGITRAGDVRARRFVV